MCYIYGTMKHAFFNIALLLFTLTAQAQSTVNWTEKELLQPAALAQTIAEGRNLPLIISVGPGALIPYSKDIGPANDTASLTALQTLLAHQKKDHKIVVYCGCCPFDRCPNVRPAIQILKDAGFENFYLLNLKTNLKTDWIDQGFPTVKN